MSLDTDRWPWPPELDALTAAPGNHQLLLENDWSDPLPPHSVENVGGAQLRVLMVELKGV
jgi:hypothetical protein